MIFIIILQGHDGPAALRLPEGSAARRAQGRETHHRPPRRPAAARRLGSAAVILQLFYNYIVSKIDSLVNDMEDSSITLMDILTAYKK